MFTLRGLIGSFSSSFSGQDLPPRHILAADGIEWRTASRTKIVRSLSPRLAILPHVCDSVEATHLRLPPSLRKTSLPFASIKKMIVRNWNLASGTPSINAFSAAF